MQILPVRENEATGSVKEVYDSLKTAFQIKSLPLFFTYIGPFPEYLSYISKQLLENVENSRFKTLAADASEQFKLLIQSELNSSEEKTSWLERYSSSPSFYFFEKDLDHIFITNVKLALIFIALREAVKGWAVAAKQLKPGFTEDVQKESQEQVSKTLASQLIFDGAELSAPVNIQTSENESNSNSPAVLENALAVTNGGTIERNLLPEYLTICRNDFSQLLKQERVLLARVTLERLLLSYIGLFPSLVFSPINVVLELTSKYNNFPELLYLLSEHFPTFAVQRMMFSGYMMK